MKLKDLFDGETHYLVPGEDFVYPCVKQIVDWETLEEEEPLGPYESPALAPVFGADWPQNLGAGLKDPVWVQKTEMAQAWGSMSVSMTTLVRIVEGAKEQYQYPHYDGSPDLFTFKYKALDEGWEGGQL